MGTGQRRVMGYVGVGLAAALAAGGLIWAISSAARSDAISRAESAEFLASELGAQVESLTATPESPTELAIDDDSAPEEASPDSDGAAAFPATDEDGRHFCYIRDVANEAGETMITVDYAEMLSGTEANAAATAAGEESPPPNDYFIRNVNPKLRTFSVQAGISVRLTTVSGGTSPNGYDVVLGQWHDFYAGMSPGMELIRGVPYWISIENGVVTSIEEQYLP